ncbi:MAG: hypothetical protein ACI924_001335 [Flavobacterium sp.]
MLNLKEAELKATNTSEGKIIDTLQKIEASNVAQSGFFRLPTMVPSVLIIPTLISIVFIRGKGKK